MAATQKRVAAEALMPTKANESELELRARLLHEARLEQAKALAADLIDQPPLEGVDPSDEELVDAWLYSPLPDPGGAFWMLITQAMAEGLPRDQAEETALRAVYPQRPILIGLGLFPLEIQVKRAERIARIVERVAKTNSAPSAQVIGAPFAQSPRSTY